MESSNGSQTTQGPRKSAKKRSPKNVKQKDSVVTTTNDFIEQEKITVKFELAPTPRMITLPNNMPRMENLTLNDLTGPQELNHQSSVESSASSQGQERRAVTKNSKPKNIQISNHRTHHQHHQHSGHAHSLEHVHQPHIHQHRHNQHQHLNHNNNNNNQHQHVHHSNHHHHHQHHHKNKHSDQSQAKVAYILKSSQNVSYQQKLSSLFLS